MLFAFKIFSLPVLVPELFGKYPTRPVLKSKTPTRRTLIVIQCPGGEGGDEGDDDELGEVSRSLKNFFASLMKLEEDHWR